MKKYWRVFVLNQSKESIRYLIKKYAKENKINKYGTLINFKLDNKC